MPWIFLFHPLVLVLRRFDVAFAFVHSIREINPLARQGRQGRDALILTAAVPYKGQVHTVQYINSFTLHVPSMYAILSGAIDPRTFSTAAKLKPW